MYRSFAHVYDRLMAPLESMFLRRWRAEALSLLPQNGRVLELGAGTGLNFEHYPKCRHAIASEISFDMIDRAKQRTKEIDLVQADAQTLPFPDDYFDSVFATLVFCSIPDPVLAFKEIQRVVKPGAPVVLLEHVRPKGVFGYFFDVLSVATVALAEDYFNRQTAQIALESGLAVVEVRTKALSVVNLIICRNR